MGLGSALFSADAQRGLDAERALAKVWAEHLILIWLALLGHNTLHGLSTLGVSTNTGRTGQAVLVVVFACSSSCRSAGNVSSTAGTCTTSQAG